MSFVVGACSTDAIPSEDMKFYGRLKLFIIDGVQCEREEWKASKYYVKSKKKVAYVIFGKLAEGWRQPSFTLEGQ